MAFEAVKTNVAVVMGLVETDGSAVTFPIPTMSRDVALVADHVRMLGFPAGTVFGAAVKKLMVGATADGRHGLPEPLVTAPQAQSLMHVPTLPHPLGLQERTPSR